MTYGHALRVYSTNVVAYGHLLNVPSYSSSDGGATWQATGDVLPAVGSWAVAGLTWAPDVHRFGDLWVLYYTARVAGPGAMQCIGVATASSATGPFVDDRGHPIACQGHLGGSIDPSVFVGPDGVPWLLYKSDENSLGRSTSRLWSHQLTPDGTNTVGHAHLLLHTDQPWEGHLIEQPEMIHASGQFWLMYSANDWQSPDYGIGFAACSGPVGPCAKHTVSGPWMRHTRHAAGTGAASLATLPGGTVLLAYHGWTPGNESYDTGGRRALHVERVRFTGAGPSLLDRIAATSWSRFHHLAPRAFYDEPVSWLADRGITTGVGGSDRFAPDDPVTRGEMATFLWRHAGTPGATRATHFADVPTGAFYTAAVRWLASEGITTGIGGSDRFAPDVPVTRGEMATFLWRRAGGSGGPGGSPFVDVPPGAFYSQAVRWLSDHDITTGVGGTNRFAPDAAVTRGEMATFLWRFDRRIGAGPAAHTASLAEWSAPPLTSGPSVPPDVPDAAAGRE